MALGAATARCTFVLPRRTAARYDVRASSSPRAMRWPLSLRPSSSIFTQAPVAVGHRVVHGGPNLRTHQLITPQVLDQLRAATHFAPLHIPQALSLIASAQSIFPSAAHFACFDDCISPDHAGGGIASSASAALFQCGYSALWFPRPLVRVARASLRRAPARTSHLRASRQRSKPLRSSQRSIESTPPWGSLPPAASPWERAPAISILAYFSIFCARRN